MAAQRRQPGPTPKSDAPRPVTRTLDRGLRILEIVADEPDLALGEIAQRCSLSPSTALRLLDTLRKRDFIAQNEDGLYRIGLRAFETGARFLSHTRLRETCRPILMRLAEETGETASLAILDGADVVYVDSGESQRRVRTASRLGTRAPAHASASGKVLLAWLWEGRVREILGSEELATPTPHTTGDVDTLLNTLADVRRHELAHDREEFELGIACLAAPVRERSGGVTAALSVSTLVGQFAAREAELGSALQSAAEDASRRLGWRPSHGMEERGNLTD